jgi:hypothetical protein
MARNSENVRSWREAEVAQAHNHAQLGMFNRTSMAAMISDSTAPLRWHGKPNADYSHPLSECER